jgi:signal transduction histidine kinase
MTGERGIDTVRAVRTERLGARWRQVHPVVADAALATIVAAVTVTSVVVTSHQQHEPVTAAGWLALAAQFAPLPWRRWAPVTVLTIVGLGALAYGMAELPDPPLEFALLLAFFTVAAHRPRRVSMPCGLVFLVVAAFALAFGDSSDAADAAEVYFAGTTAWVVGDTMRGQRERARWLEERRVDAARRAVADERVRIARDLHDVVAHHVSVMAVQAEAAQEVLTSRPDQAQRAMANVADTARTTLTELRRLLGVLRAPDDLGPQPDLGTIDELVSSVRDTGLEVTVRAADAPEVGGVVGVTAYRVVQEALTNVIKHAGARRAEVDVAMDGDAVVVTVTDDGRPGAKSGAPAVPGGGHGLAGMRERVSLLGGSLEAGPRPGGGFAVRARLPVR